MKTFKVLFGYLSENARFMKYWKGSKQTMKEELQPPPPYQLATGFVKGRLRKQES